MFRIYPYKIGSKSVAKLKEVLSAKIIKLENSSYHFNPNHIIINWGNSTLPSWLTDSVRDFVLNKPEAVRTASNKLDAFHRLSASQVRTVPYTTDIAEAQQWLSGGHKVFARHVLNGHSGEGIEVVSAVTTPEFTVEQLEVADYLREVASELDALDHTGISSEIRQIVSEMEPEGMDTLSVVPRAPLYTKGVNNNGEYRVHVFDNEVILYQKKSRRVDEETGDVVTAEGEAADIRNLETNWVYRTGNLRRLERVEELAKSAISALGLDFGAVDIIMDNNGDVFVLEVNTAPGLGNTETIEAYTNAFNNLTE